MLPEKLKLCLGAGIESLAPVTSSYITNVFTPHKVESASIIRAASGLLIRGRASLVVTLSALDSC